jgi:DNA-binding MarR family transcriptional regulator
MTVQQLLDILRITKQSLGRVLKELIDKGYVFQKEGEADRRQRLLYLTEKGEELRQRLMRPQMNRIRRAIAAIRRGCRRSLPQASLQHGFARKPREREGLDRPREHHGRGGLRRG